MGLVDELSVAGLKLKLKTHNSQLRNMHTAIVQ